MKANCWTGRNSVEVLDVPDPSILSSRDAIVKVTSTAICGSDLHLVDGYVPTMEKGDILGHEFMGEVVEVGPGVNPKLRVGDRVVVPFPIACGSCASCRAQLYSCCENTNPNAGISEKLFGHPTAGIYGYSHLTGGFAGGQSEYARVVLADANVLKIDSDLTDEQVLFLSDILPTGYMGAEMCDIQGGDVVAVWGAGPVGQFAMDSARVLGAEKVIAIDKEPYRLAMAASQGYETINFEDTDVRSALLELTGGRGPDKCIDAVGLEATHGASTSTSTTAPSRRSARDRPPARPAPGHHVLPQRGRGVGHRRLRRHDRQVPGGRLDEQVPDPAHRPVPRAPVHEAAAGPDRTGQARPHPHHHHRLPLTEAPKGYDLFKNKKDHCEKVVLTP